jgi:hypothetical protein
MDRANLSKSIYDYAAEKRGSDCPNQIENFVDVPKICNESVIGTAQLKDSLSEIKETGEEVNHIMDDTVSCDSAEQA